MGIQPGSTLRNRDRLRIINPAPISSTSDSATSETTSTLRVRLPPESASVRPKPCFNESFRFVLLARTAGTKPAARPVSRRDRKSECQHPAIHGDVRRAREALSQESNDQLHSEMRKDEP